MCPVGQSSRPAQGSRFPFAKACICIIKFVPAEEEEWVEHEVENGDTLYAIAREHLVLIYQIKEWNDLAGHALKPGQIIRVRRVEWPAYRGKASWYGPGFHGRTMANGEVYNMHEVLVAHRTLPLGLRLKITNLDNGKTIVATIRDRGPYTVKNGVYDREVDLSFAAAKILGAIEPGVIPVHIEPLNL